MVQANLLAASTPNTEAVNQVYNIAVGCRTTLDNLYALLKQNLLSSFPHLKDAQAVYRGFRAGDVRHSLASIDKARNRLGYEPSHSVGQGVVLAMPWYTTRPGTYFQKASHTHHN